MQRGQVACYVFAFTRETKTECTPERPSFCPHLESVNARAASKCCGLCAASFVCVISSLFPFLFKRFRPSLFFRLVSDENSSPTFVYSRSRYLENGHLMVLLRQTVLFCIFKYRIRPKRICKLNKIKCNIREWHILQIVVFFLILIGYAFVALRAN